MDRRAKRCHKAGGSRLKAAVVGGKLQGVEAVYLAKKAGWTVVLLDKEINVPAQNLADEFYQLDVTCQQQAADILQDCQLIIPALENKTALHSLGILAEKINVPFVFDAAAYQISASKLASNELFLQNRIPIPRLWPNCRFPIVVKPSGASGSADVKRIESAEALKELAIDNGNLQDLVVQEFVSGPSYSIEVIGFNGCYQVFQVTELEMDQAYDCKRVLAPANLAPELAEALADIAIKAATALALNGIMDVEVILHDQQLKVLEIDARLPSQTPTAVFHSTGLNILEILGLSFVSQGLAYRENPLPERGVVYEHLRVTPEGSAICGEHVMAQAGPLHLQTDFFGADEALTNYSPESNAWVATLINTGRDRDEAWSKRNRVLKLIAGSIGQSSWEDLSPQE